MLILSVGRDASPVQRRVVGAKLTTSTGENAAKRMVLKPALLKARIVGQATFYRGSVSYRRGSNGVIP